MDDPQSLNATLDGHEFDPAICAESPDGGYTQVAPEGSLLASLIGPGEFAPSVADGYWLMLAPLSVGTHELSFSAVAADGFSVDVTYELEVVGGKGKSEVALPELTGMSEGADDDPSDFEQASLDYELTKSKRSEKIVGSTNGNADKPSEAPVATKDAAEAEKDAATDAAIMTLMSLGL